MLLKGEVGGSALDSHGNYIVDHGKSWKNHGIVFLNFCGNPVLNYFIMCVPTSSYIIIGFLINVQVQGHHPHQWAPFQVTG